jgi:uncharacterized membrane protein
MSPRTSPARPAARAGWPVPLALTALSAVPLLAGALRLVQLAGGPSAMPPDDRFTGFPVALVVHIVGAAVYALVGSLQFVPRFRRRHLTWHRRAGRLLAVAGVLVAGSALWLTLFVAPQPGTGDLLYVLRLVVGSSMIACLVLGFTSIRRRDVAAHRAWMIRAYALALAAGTQVFTEGVGGALVGTGGIRGDLAKAAGWVVNLAVAEWIIRRPAGGRPARHQPAGRRSSGLAAATRRRPAGATP